MVCDFYLKAVYKKKKSRGDIYLIRQTIPHQVFSDTNWHSGFGKAKMPCKSKSYCIPVEFFPPPPQDFIYF